MKKIVGVVLALLLAGAAVATALVTSSSPASAARRSAVAYDCRGSHHGQIRPDQVLLDCMSGNVLVKTPAWRYWTAVSARSRDAVLWVNTCHPDCAAGHYRKYPAQLVLYRARDSHGSRVLHAHATPVQPQRPEEVHIPLGNVSRGLDPRLDRRTLTSSPPRRHVPRTPTAVSAWSPAAHAEP